MFKCHCVAWQRGIPWQFADCVSVPVNKHSFESFICEWEQQSFLFHKKMKKDLLHSVSLENDATYNWNFLWMANSLNISTVCAQLDFVLTSFVCSLLNCQYSCSKVTQPFLVVCWLRFCFFLGYAVHIFHTTDAKYVTFRIGWCKSLKGSATPGTLIDKLFCRSFCKCMRCLNSSNLHIKFNLRYLNIMLTLMFTR